MNRRINRIALGVLLVAAAMHLNGCGVEMAGTAATAASTKAAEAEAASNTIDSVRGKLAGAVGTDDN